jgi:hypothetical protein
MKQQTRKYLQKNVKTKNNRLNSNRKSKTKKVNIKIVKSRKQKGGLFSSKKTKLRKQLIEVIKECKPDIKKCETLIRTVVNTPKYKIKYRKDKNIDTFTTDIIRLVNNTDPNINLKKEVKRIIYNNITSTNFIVDLNLPGLPGAISTVVS